MTTWSKYFQHKYHRAINGWAAPPLDKDKPPNCPDSTDAGSWHLSKCPAQCSLAHQYIRRKGWAWFPLCWTANDPNFHAQFMLILSILNAVIFVQLSIFPLLWSRLISISIFKLGIIHPFITDNYEIMFIADIRTCSRSIIWYWPIFFAFWQNKYSKWIMMITIYFNINIRYRDSTAQLYEHGQILLTK